MSIGPGTKLGSFEILNAIGAGGMGVVYLARDTRLDRDVAIKALPEHFSQDPGRLERFEREAKTLAQLNHPNVAGIHGVEEHEGARYLVLEYVEGETLADRLDRGAMPVDEALEIAVQIAEGVEAAHEAGVIHRDLKPGNIIVTPEGQAKVLDFGLAKAEEAASSISPDEATVTSPARHSPTMPGVILGTAAYMRPEQARGRRLDKRTDIWSFGVMLYEMLTGVGPFHGETINDSIGAVLHKDVDLDRLPPNTSPLVARVLKRCLARDKAQRYRDIGEVRIELQMVVESPQQHEMATPSSRRGSVAALITVVGLIMIATGAGGFLAGKRAASPPEPVRGRFEFPLLQAPTYSVGRPAISPDGTMIAYIEHGWWQERRDASCAYHTTYVWFPLVACDTSQSGGGRRWVFRMGDPCWAPRNGVQSGRIGLCVT